MKLKCLNTVLTVISLITTTDTEPDIWMRLNTVLTVISLIFFLSGEVMAGALSQYRSHGYLFNLYGLVLTSCSGKSQYRSHGYLFNLRGQRLKR